MDDELAVRQMARAVLQQMDFKPLTAIDGADGLIQVVQHRTDIHAIITARSSCRTMETREPR